jgi:hypothetical protein
MTVTLAGQPAQSAGVQSARPRGVRGSRPCRLVRLGSPLRRFWQGARGTVPDNDEEKGADGHFLEHRPRTRDVRRTPLEQRLRRCERRRPAGHAAARAGWAVAGPARHRGRRARRRPAPAAARALPRHPGRPPVAPAGRLRQGHRRIRLPGRLYGRLPDQGQPAARRGRRAGGSRRTGLWPGGRLQARADGRAGDGPARQPGDLQRLQGSRIRTAGADRPEDGPAHPHRDREAVRTGPRAGRGESSGGRAPARRARAAGIDRRGQVAEHGRRQGQVRPQPGPGAGADPAAGRRRPEAHAEAAAFPHGLADLQRARHRRRHARGGALLRGAAPAGRGDRDRRRRRWPGRGLRRYALAQLQLDQLLARAIRREHRAAAGRGRPCSATACRRPTSSPSRAAP